MLLTFPLPAQLDGQTLAEELTAAGVTVATDGPVVGADGDTLVLRVEDGTDEKTVADVVAAHTGAMSAEASTALDNLATLQVLAAKDSLTNDDVLAAIKALVGVAVPPLSPDQQTAVDVRAQTVMTAQPARVAS